ncbi:MAG: ABC transporter ATP-binding protein [Bacteriovoracaceae bacterium]|jgi:ATP-binding cassette, subfamily B, bacterial|nr:ABC transporter ATP-binding protein [Bacteriovoracaceae bacterium]
MNTQSAFIKKYFGQEGKLGAEVASFLFREHGVSKVLAYAYSDLKWSPDGPTSGLSWVVLGEGELFNVEVDFTGRARLVQSVKVDPKFKIVLDNGRSLGRFSVRDELGDVVFNAYFSNRQREGFSNLKSLAERPNIEGLSWAKDADSVYADSLCEKLYEQYGSKTDTQSSVVFRLLGYLKPYKKEMAWGAVGAVFMTVFQLVPPYLTGYLIDDVIKPFQGGVLTFEKARSLGVILLVGLILTFAIREFFVWMRLRFMSIIGEWVARDLRTQTYDHLQEMDLDYFGSNPTGSLISRVSSDSDRLWDFVAFGVVEVGVSLIQLLGISAVLIHLDFKLGLLISLPVPLFLYAIYSHGEKLKVIFTKCFRKWSSMTAVLSDTIPGIRVVKAFSKEDEEKERFLKINENMATYFNQVHETWTKFWPLLMFSFHFLVFLVWAFAMPRLLSSGDAALTAGVFVSFVLYMTMFQAPIEVIGQIARMVNRATSSAHRIFEVLDATAKLKEQKGGVALNPLVGRVDFEDVGFSYNGVSQVLKNISFSVRPGEMIGIVGYSGAGKSTLMQLLCRFWEVTSGEILIDGYPLKELDIKSYRRQVGMVLQDPYLFHGTMMSNISYGKEGATFEEIVAASKAANCHEFISKLPQGYETMIGERGQTLSGGERQRVSIARAVLMDPKVLILDEATSSVDTKTEKKIQEALDRLSRGRTVFAIAHRLSTLKNADRILVMDDGKLVENGTHLELLENKKGLYTKLIEMQSHRVSETIIQ